MRANRETTPNWLLPGPLRRLREHLREIRRLVGATLEQVGAARAEQNAGIARVESRLHELVDQAHATTTAQATRHEQVIEALRFIHSRGHEQRERLRELRSEPSYERPYTDPEPLISVVIPTYDNHRLLRERSIPSVLAQTYQNFEVVVVGDAAPEGARLAAESFDDPRVRFSNLPYRGPYPQDPEERWKVAGVPPYNEGVRLARGLWIARLDDDDAFRPHHLARLLAYARAERVEFAYARLFLHRGSFLMHRDAGSIGRFPPELGHFGLQSALYHHGVARIFDLELAEAALGLPDDWGMCRRMMEAGVRIGMLDEDTVDYYPSRAWTPRWSERAPAWAKVFTSVFDDPALLPHFLRHYADLGIHDFYVAAPPERESEVERLAEGYGVTVVGTAGSESLISGRARDATRRLRDDYQGEDEWALIVDADEFVAFPEGIASTIAAAEAEGANAVTGVVYDRFSVDGKEAPVAPGTALAEQYPVRARFIRDVMRGLDHKAVLVKGHPQRAGGADEKVASMTLEVEHYGWTEGSIERLKERCRAVAEIDADRGMEYQRAIEHYEANGRFAWEEFGGELSHAG